MSRILTEFREADTTAEEPALRIGAIGSAITAIFVVVNALWPKLLSTDVQNAITAILLFIIPLVVAIITRQKVWAPATVEVLVAAAVRESEIELTKRFEVRRRIPTKTTDPFPYIKPDDSNDPVNP